MDKKEYDKLYYLANKDKRKKQILQYYKDNRDEILKKESQYYIDNKEKRLSYIHKYYQNNRDDILEEGRKYYIDNKDRILEEGRKHYMNNKGRILESRNKKKEVIYKFLREYKQSHPCEICGQANPDYLDFHHIYTKKKNTEISKLVTRDLSFVKSEVSKCRVICIHCHRDIHIKVSNTTNKYLVRNREFVDSYKSSHPCVICGQTNPKYLDFHHNNIEDKETEISKLMKSSLKKIKTEIEKCQILCGYCHRDVHNKFYQEEEES